MCKCWHQEIIRFGDGTTTTSVSTGRGTGTTFTVSSGVDDPETSIKSVAWSSAIGNRGVGVICALSTKVSNHVGRDA